MPEGVVGMSWMKTAINTKEDALMKQLDEVVLDHGKWNPGYPHLVTVRDRATGNIIFADTLRGTADWLDIFGYKWAGVQGVWKKEN